MPAAGCTCRFRAAASRHSRTLASQASAGGRPGHGRPVSAVPAATARRRRSCPHRRQHRFKLGHMGGRHVWVELPGQRGTCPERGAKESSPRTKLMSQAHKQAVEFGLAQPRQALNPQRPGAARPLLLSRARRPAAAMSAARSGFAAPEAGPDWRSRTGSHRLAGLQGNPLASNQPSRSNAARCASRRVRAAAARPA